MMYLWQAIGRIMPSWQAANGGFVADQENDEGGCLISD
jgi:hypothetical protein